jgi:hypothetical protein
VEFYCFSSRSRDSNLENDEHGRMYTYPSMLYVHRRAGTYTRGPIDRARLTGYLEVRTPYFVDVKHLSIIPRPATDRILLVPSTAVGGRADNARATATPARTPDASPSALSQRESDRAYVRASRRRGTPLEQGAPTRALAAFTAQQRLDGDVWWPAPARARPRTSWTVRCATATRPDGDGDVLLRGFPRRARGRRGVSVRRGDDHPPARAGRHEMAGRACMAFLSEISSYFSISDG